VDVNGSPTEPARFIDIGGVTLHYEWVGTQSGRRPLVFLHEGLGSVELWRDFPAEVAALTRRSGLVYSRLGNGWSTPLSVVRRPDYMHAEALRILPRLLGELTEGPPILVGHSDGASISIIYAGAGHPVDRLVLIAPHVMVESETVASIAAIRQSFEEARMADRMAKYHADPVKTFYGWADIWLSPSFRDWDIRDCLSGISAPTLLIQGENDEYGTIDQLNAIESTVAGQCQTMVIAGAGHSPHLSHPHQVTGAIAAFVDDERS